MAEQLAGKKNPLVIHGHWKVAAVDVAEDPEGVGIGIIQNSKLTIRPDGQEHVLEKNSSDIGWEPTKPGIQLFRVDSIADQFKRQFLKAQNFILFADITFAGDAHLLAFGSDDTGTTLKILLAGNPGGTGTAGRGT
jgi:hypothetical protein